ncbi:hypothetical protein SAMN05216456_1942 [Devosia crocina]|uniref:Helix-turn-helix domain-containing protein n=1 Tax=Devosia crocina TaxID=429728 RepID=A0A1I7NF36_9HYPH|nr:hypothetical protein [Devosia crocina]SFV33275.1 hypothetical protein SAMN05216456_1942 [Devosia crocina]
MSEPLRARDQRLAPRGLNREQAAAYIGISASTFDKLVEAGAMPRPRMAETRKIWDIHEIDRAFDELPHEGASLMAANQAGSAVSDWN